MTGRGLLRSAFGVSVVLSLALVSGCDGKGFKRTNKSEFVFDGVEFKASAKAIDKKENRKHFQVSVRKATRSLDGAKEAGRYAGVRYCIEQYGTSRIEWINGPDQENGTLTLDKEDLILEGLCKL